MEILYYLYIGPIGRLYTKIYTKIYCTCTLLSCQLPDELHKSKTGLCRDLNALSYLIYNRHGFRILLVLTAMAVTGLCPITFANIYKYIHSRACRGGRGGNCPPKFRRFGQN